MIAGHGREAVVLLGALAAVVVWNAAWHPPGLGYDAGRMSTTSSA